MKKTKPTILIVGLLSVVGAGYFFLSDNGNRNEKDKDLALSKVPGSDFIEQKNRSNNSEQFPPIKVEEISYVDDSDNNADKNITGENLGIVKKPEYDMAALVEDVMQAKKSDKFASYDNDDSTYTSQEYNEAMEKQLVQFREELRSIRDRAASGELGRVAGEVEIRQQLMKFVEASSRISNMRKDQSHKYSLANILKEHPQLLAE